MAKYSDHTKASSKARLCEYRNGESAEARHDRRYETAQKYQAVAKAWAEKHGWTFTVANDGHHFIFRRPGDPQDTPFAQWWPRSAKLVIQCQWKRGIHAHDVMQVIREINARTTTGTN